MRTKPLSVGVAALAVLTASACGATGRTPAPAPRPSGKPVTGLRMMVPNTPGGGYDITARTAAKVMEDDEDHRPASRSSTSPAPAARSAWPAHGQREGQRRPDACMMGLGVVGATYTNKSKATLTDTTPIAKLIEEPGAHHGAQGLAVQDHRRPGRRRGRPTRRRSASAAARRPAAPTTCCRCSSPRPSASTPRRSTTSSYDGGGDLLPALLGNKIDFGTSGVGEFLDQIEAGEMRVLATTGEERVDALSDVPDAQGAGHRPGLHQLARRRGPSRHQRRRQGQAGSTRSTKMHDTQAWKDALRPRTAGPTPS